MQHYDEAAHAFYSKQTIKTMPVNAWDMFSKNLAKVCSNLKDINSIQQLSKQNGWQRPPHIENEILAKKHVVVITDAQLQIVHATNTIFDMNGYTPEEIIGQQPKIFQGKDTCKTTAFKISEAIKKEEAFEAVILNYRKDGSPYKCWIKGKPILNRKGQLVNFIAFEKEVA